MQTAALEARNRPAPKTHLKRHPRFDEKLVQHIEAMADAVQEMFHQSLDRNEPTSEMRDRLVERLREGKLLAFGVRTQPPGPVEMSSLPALFFKGRPKVDLQKGTVENFRERYEAVEVAKRTESSVMPRAPRQKVGRPRKSDKIEEVAIELYKAKRFLNLLEKEKVALVQTECRKRYSESFPKDPAQTLVRQVLKALKHH